MKKLILTLVLTVGVVGISSSVFAGDWDYSKHATKTGVTDSDSSCSACCQGCCGPSEGVKLETKKSSDAKNKSLECPLTKAKAKKATSAAAAADHSHSH